MRTRALNRVLQHRWIHIAHVDQLATILVSLDGLEMVGGDTPAAHQRETQLAVGDGGAANVHRFNTPAAVISLRFASILGVGYRN